MEVLLYAAAVSSLQPLRATTSYGCCSTRYAPAVRTAKLGSFSMVMTQTVAHPAKAKRDLSRKQDLTVARKRYILVKSILRIT